MMNVKGRGDFCYQAGGGFYKKSIRWQGFAHRWRKHNLRLITFQQGRGAPPLGGGF